MSLGAYFRGSKAVLVDQPMSVFEKLLDLLNNPPDVLDIPATMELGYNVTIGIAWGFVGIFLVLDIITETFKMVRNVEIPNYWKIVTDFILVIIGLICYKLIFLKIVALCEGVGLSLCSLDTEYNILKLFMGESEGSFSLIHINFSKIVMYLVSMLSLVSYMLFSFVRYCLLSILYVFGPIAFLGAGWSKTRKLFYGWFKNVFQFSAWIIIFRIVILAINSFYSQMEKIGDANPIMYICFAVLFSIMIWGTPLITARLFSGEHLGMAATGMLSMGSKMITTASVLFGAKFVRGAVKVSGALGRAGVTGGSSAAKWMKEEFAETLGQNRSDVTGDEPSSRSNIPKVDRNIRDRAPNKKPKER